MKEAAHAHEGKVNDVILALWSGGLRQLLLTRGEPVTDVELVTGLAVSLRSATDSGTINNQVGTMVLPLPIGEAEAQRRLDLIVAATRKAKAEQRPAAIMGYMAGLAATPIGRYYTTHQHASNVIITSGRHIRRFVSLCDISTSRGHSTAKEIHSRERPTHNRAGRADSGRFGHMGDMAHSCRYGAVHAAAFCRSELSPVSTSESLMRLVSIGEADLEVDVRGWGEPVVLIQTALTADELLPMARQPALQDSYRVILYHRRGYGRSSPVEGPGSIMRDARDCRDLLAVLEIESAHIVGVSYSAAIALQLAVTAPSRVHTLILIEPPPVHVPNAGEFIAATKELLKLHRTKGTSVALDNFLTRLMGPQWRDDVERHLPGAVRQVERDAATFFATDIPALLSWDFDAEAARRISQPTLYIGGNESGPWFEAVHELMSDWVSPSEDVLVAGADHNLAVTHPGQVARTLTNFIARHPISA